VSSTQWEKEMANLKLTLGIIAINVTFKTENKNK